MIRMDKDRSVENNAWTNPRGQGHSGWEEMPYWLKGYGDLGYVLHDQAIIKEAKKWIDAVLSSQDADGWFGPREIPRLSRPPKRDEALQVPVRRAALDGAQPFVDGEQEDVVGLVDQWRPWLEQQLGVRLVQRSTRTRP